MRKIFPYKYFRVFILLFALTSFGRQAVARDMYGYQISDSLIKSLSKKDMEQKKNASIFVTTVKSKPIQRQAAQPHVYHNRAFDFYIIIFLIAFFAILKSFNSHYFRSLFKAFSKSTVSTRQLKDQLQNNAGANLGMNIFFCLSLATYAFYVIKYMTKGDFGNSYSPFIILTAAILVLVCTYSLRFLSLKFAGWIFNIDTATDTYTFNIFLINKILSITLLPFTVILALGSGQWVQVALFLSLIVIALLTLNRFARSGSSMRSFIKYSKFHFFLYLCASEILPIAILWKVVYIWLVK